MLTPSPIVTLEDDRFAQHAVRVLLKRDDLISSDLPGNKWRKLRHNLTAARTQGHHRLLTFGGAYSNHIRAVAAAGDIFEFSTVGVIRGEELAGKQLNWSLSQAREYGMQLAFMERSRYRRKNEPGIVDSMRDEYGEFYLIPEGGSNALAVKGAMDIPAEITVPYNVICCPVGTGGTLAGIAAGLSRGSRALGFSALKGGDFLYNDVRALQRDAGVPTNNWEIDTRFHFGGFAKRTSELDEFIDDFHERHGVSLEPTYVAKMMAGILSLVNAGAFQSGTTVVAVITG